MLRACWPVFCSKNDDPVMAATTISKILHIPPPMPGPPKQGPLKQGLFPFQLAISVNKQTVERFATKNYFA